MRPLWHRVKPRQPLQLMHIHVLLSLSSSSFCLSFCSIFFFFFFYFFLSLLRATWPFPAPSRSPSLWRSPTPTASSSCQGRLRGRQGRSRWHCSSGRGTRLGFSWPLTSRGRKASSVCTSVRPGSAYKSVRPAGPCWSSAQVSPLVVFELMFFLWVFFFFASKHESIIQGFPLTLGIEQTSGEC